MLPDYQPVFQKYNNDLKPLISEIEGRVERFSQSLLLNIASVYDYMSISAAEGQDKDLCLAEADGYVDFCYCSAVIDFFCDWCFPINLPRDEVNPESWTLAAKDRYLNSIMYGIL